MAEDDRPVRQPQDAEREAESLAPLLDMTKDQLRAEAEAKGIEVPASATKAELLAALGVPSE